MSLNRREIAVVKGMLARGDKQQDIAAYFGINGGRIAEINTGQNPDADGVLAAAPEGLPKAGPIMAGRSAQRALDTLVALRDLIDETIQEIETFERDGR